MKVSFLTNNQKRKQDVIVGRQNMIKCLSQINLTMDPCGTPTNCTEISSMESCATKLFTKYCPNLEDVYQKGLHVLSCESLLDCNECNKI